jgi:polyphosphate kinase 2 (PPK2 family)
VPTSVKPVCTSKKQYRKLLEEHVDTLSKQQRLHDASGRYALLLIVQGMDAAGKDGAISYYAEVLIVRVHPTILRGQGLPDECRRRHDLRAIRKHSRSDRRTGDQ